MQGSGKRLTAALALTLFSSALDLVCITVLPGFVGWALSAGKVPPSGLPLLAGIQGGGDAPLAIMTSSIVALFLLRAVVTILVGAYLSKLAQAIRRENTGRIVAGMLRSPYAETLDRSAAHCIVTTTGHTSHFAQSVVLPLLKLVVDTTTIIGLLAYLAWQMPLLTAGVGLVLATTGVAYTLLVRRSNLKHSQRVVQLDTHLGQTVSQALQGSREVRIYQAQAFFEHGISDTLHRLEFSQARLGAIYWLPRALGELVLILVAITYMVFTTRGGMTEVFVLSSLSAFAFAGMRLLPAFAQSMVGVAMVRAGEAVTALLADEVRRQQTTLTLPPQRTTDTANLSAFQSLELKDIRFAYGDRPPVLDGVNLSIQRGQSVGIIGRSGAGKSTLGDVILGLLTPQQGSILVNGTPCTLADPAWWNRVGFVPQNPFIANDTLARNVAYGIPDDQINPEKVRQALELAQLGPLIAQYPHGLATLLGEAGVRLSGGQRQRVAIARALYRNREILVLDEATSALDEETEKEVIQAITALHGTVTIVAIAHRQSTLRSCDFVVETKDGKLSA